jgi:hypothetical protein
MGGFSIVNSKRLPEDNPSYIPSYIPSKYHTYPTTSSKIPIFQLAINYRHIQLLKKYEKMAQSKYLIYPLFPWIFHRFSYVYHQPPSSAGAKNCVVVACVGCGTGASTWIGVPTMDCTSARQWIGGKKLENVVKKIGEKYRKYVGNSKIET